MSMINTITQYALISGLVQGVYFRQSTQQQAQALGLVGWVRNLSDGRVEVCWQGAPQAVGALQAWLQHGPEEARVDDLLCQDCGLQSLAGFEALPTAHHLVKWS